MAKRNDSDRENQDPVVNDKRRIDPETGDVREQPEAEVASGQDAAPVDGEALSAEDQSLLDQAERDLVAEMRSDMLRAQAELVNFRTRVERDRAANREAVIAEVLRSMLPVVDDLDLAEVHGDLVEGAPLTLVAAKLRATFDKFGFVRVGVKGEAFDPTIHEAVVMLPTPGATEQSVADVIQIGYKLGERLVRAAKVAVSVPAE